MESNSKGVSHKATAIKDRYLTFDLDGEKYGIEILSVKEIIGLQKTIHVPRTPEYVKGVMNLRGVIIPVIDLRKKLHMEEVEAQMDTAIIIVMIHGVNVGFVVDRVDEVKSISEDELSESPTFGSKISANFIKKMARTKSNVIMLLDLSAIFDAEELSGIENLSKNQNNDKNNLKVGEAG